MTSNSPLSGSSDSVDERYISRNNRRRGDPRSLLPEPYR